MSTKRAVYDVAEFKALPDDGDDRGRFEALVSVFGNVDLQGDRVVEGAFKDSLAAWQAKSAPIPIIWSHDWGNPNAHIGSAEPGDVVEVKGRGLKVSGTIDLDNPFAAQVFRLLKERRVREFSFGYEVVKERKGDDGANELVKLNIIEAGPTLKGANPNTELLAVKSQLEEAAAVEPVVKITTTEPVIDAALARRIVEVLGEKAGRSISSKNETRIREAVEAHSRGNDLLTEVLASLGDADEKTDPGEADEPKAQADEVKATVDPTLLALQALIVNTKE